MLFTDRSVWTMIHGIVLGGIFLLACSSAAYNLWSLRYTDGNNAGAAQGQTRFLAGITTLMAASLWLTLIVALFVVFPQYRVSPPQDATDLTMYPRYFLLADPSTSWLHAFAMEAKEHMPWSAAMLMTAVAYIAARYNSRLIGAANLRRILLILLLVSFVVSLFVGMMGVFVNKVAPLQ